MRIRFRVRVRVKMRVTVRCARAPYLRLLRELVVGPIETAVVSNYMM